MGTDTIEPGKTFVRFQPEGAHGDPFPAFVAGILGPKGESLLLWLINRKKITVAERKLCVQVPPTSIGSVVGLIAREPAFGVGEVVTEERIDGILYLNLFRDGEYSGPVAVTELTFCCPS